MIAATTAGEGVLDATGLGKMARIDQIVVLMMENRSFDHILGYLSLEGGRAGPAMPMCMRAWLTPCTMCGARPSLRSKTRRIRACRWRSNCKTITAASSATMGKRIRVIPTSIWCSVTAMGTICPCNDFLAQDFAPLALAGELAAVAPVPVQSEAEAGVIAAQRHVARPARNAQAAHGKTAPRPAGRCWR